jgi:CrcB protein
LSKTIVVLFGGALGTGCRYWLATFVYSVIIEPTFPYANLIVNVSGSLIIGFLAGLFEQRVLVSPTLRAGLFTGVLGAILLFPALLLRLTHCCVTEN